MADSPSSSNGQIWKTLDASQLKDVLDRHERFLAGKAGGRRAALAFHDLCGCDLSGCDLSGADLTGAKLKQARLSGAALKGANLFCADLRMANLERADLSGADLRGICLRGAEMSDAVLVDADFRQASLARYVGDGAPETIDFEEVPSQLTAVVAQRVDLSRAKMANTFLL